MMSVSKRESREVAIDRMRSALERKSRIERLREIVAKVEQGEVFSAFDLAVEFDVSLNAIYRDVRALKDSGLVPESFTFARRSDCVGLDSLVDGGCANPLHTEDVDEEGED